MFHKKSSKIAGAVAIVLAAAQIFTGCGFNSGSDTASSEGSSDSADSLNIMVWDGTWSEDMFTDFEDETGIKVNVSFISNTDEILTKLVNGSSDIDLIDLESAYVLPFVKNDLLAEIDHSKIPNEKNIDEKYRTMGADGDEDMKHLVIDMAPNYTTVVYNKETCPIEIKSLKDLADPALKGQVALVDSTISLYGAALVSLGYDAGSTNEDEIKEAQDLLMKIKENTKAFVGESAVPQLENGEVSCALCWDYPTLCNDSKDNWDKFGFVNLEGGCEYFAQYWAIPKNSKKVEEAEELINFICKPEEIAKSYTEWGLTPIISRDLIEQYLPDGYYDNPSISGMDYLYDDSWKIGVDDAQIDIMDKYYTELKGGE